MSSELKSVADYWSSFSAKYTDRAAGRFWWEVPGIQNHINQKISGNPDVDWVEYTLHKYFHTELPLTKCLSLGCGNGDLERSLACHGAFVCCDAYDVAPGSIELAKRLAKSEGFDHISYYVADINAIDLSPNSYDAVWIDSAMHHFTGLEHICRQIRRSLKPKGLLILNEYIGPNRFQFPSRQKEIANACLRLLPNQYRVFFCQAQKDKGSYGLSRDVTWYMKRLIGKFRDRDLGRAILRRIAAFKDQQTRITTQKEYVQFPTVSDVTFVDPSEAVRSAEIIDVLQREFEIVERRDFGGNITQFLFAGIAGNFTGEENNSQALLRMLLAVEETLLECGELTSDFAFIVARPV